MENEVKPILMSGGGVEVTATEVAPTTPEPVPSHEELSAKARELGEELRTLILRTKRLPRDKGLDPHQDPSRALAISQSYLQTGFMWLRRAINPTKDF